ncbi:MAG: serine--tRNA ligase [Patescibacteria group bacterium]|jgi:seryl-tRNA synthetase|nr:serine--tRNA ligase [Patescibacteria group bacterium]
MLDIKYIRENADEVQKAANNKNIKLDVAKLLDIDKKRREIVQGVEDLRAKKNDLAKQAKGGRPSPEQIEEGKKTKEKTAKLEDKLKEVEKEYFDLMVKVPTIPSEDTPIGKSEAENVEIEKWGTPRVFDFKLKDHIELGRDLDLLDLERGAKVAGYRGYYVRNEAVMLQMGLMMYALDKLVTKGFSPMIPPTLTKAFPLFGSGYFSGREYSPENDEIYKVENNEVNEDGTKAKEDKFLVGTAEPSLLAFHSGEVIDDKDLPLKLCGYSQCYRSEIGSYGKDTKGIYRVHEFMKVEQVCITRANTKEADKLHLEMLEIAKEMHQDLGLPYRILSICTGDMSAGKYKMFDIEAWIPSRDAYGETGSASNFLDWQSRRLNVKYRDKEGENKFVYMLNNTAMPSPRMMIAVMENYQNEDGSINIPEVLHKYIPGGVKIIKAKH